MERRKSVIDLLTSVLNFLGLLFPLSFMCVLLPISHIAYTTLVCITNETDASQ